MTDYPPPEWGDKDEQADNERLPWGLYAACAGIITGLLLGNFWPT